MCGRFVQSLPAAEMARLFKTKNPLPNVQARFNAAPGQEIAVVRLNPQTQDRSLDLLTWGLVPSWAKDRKIGWKTINARSETVQSTPAFREAYRKRRCIVPVNAFYEWTGPKGAKQPHAIAMSDRAPFALAGLWEGWRIPETGNWLRTFTVLTTRANETIAPLHDRMPVILAPEDHDRWLDAAAPADDLLRPYPADKMETWMVSPRVNSAATDDGEMLNSL